MPSVSLAHLLDEHHQLGQFTMVVKTETCSFSEFKIFPGHGKMFIEKMGKAHRFINAKCESLHHQRKKAQKLTWTCMWRRLHKKNISSLAGRKRRSRKAAFRSNRSIGGMTADAIRSRRAEKPSVRSAQRAETSRKIKERRKARKKTVKRSARNTQKAAKGKAVFKGRR